MPDAGGNLVNCSPLVLLCVDISVLLHFLGMWNLLKILNLLTFSSEIWDLASYCRQKQIEYQERGMHNRRDCVPGKLRKADANGVNTDDTKRIKLDEQHDPNMIMKNVAFFRAQYSDTDPTKCFPKTRLHQYATRKRLDVPSYVTRQEDRLFQTVLTFNGHKYASSYWEKNKKFAEQGSALVCGLHLGLIDEELLIKNGSILK